MNWRLVWETIKYIPSAFFGVLMIASVPLIIIGLSYPSIFFSKYLKKRKSASLILNILLVILFSFVNFVAITFAYELIIIAPIDVAYGRGTMNIIFIGLGFPTMVGILIRNIREITDRNYFNILVDKLLPD